MALIAVVIRSHPPYSRAPLVNVTWLSHVIHSIMSPSSDPRMRIGAAKQCRGQPFLLRMLRIFVVALRFGLQPRKNTLHSPKICRSMIFPTRLTSLLMWPLRASDFSDNLINLELYGSEFWFQLHSWISAFLISESDSALQFWLRFIHRVQQINYDMNLFFFVFLINYLLVHPPDEPVRAKLVVGL